MGQVWYSVQELGPGDSPTFADLNLTGGLTVAGTSTLDGTSITTLTGLTTWSASGTAFSANSTWTLNANKFIKIRDASNQTYIQLFAGSDLDFKAEGIMHLYGKAGQGISQLIGGVEVLGLDTAAATLTGDLKIGSGYVIKNNNIQVLAAQQAAVADATGAGDVVAQLNALLARLRTHGIIAT